MATLDHQRHAVYVRFPHHVQCVLHRIPWRTNERVARVRESGRARGGRGQYPTFYVLEQHLDHVLPLVIVLRTGERANERTSEARSASETRGARVCVPAHIGPGQYPHRYGGAPCRSAAAFERYPSWASASGRADQTPRHRTMTPKPSRRRDGARDRRRRGRRHENTATTTTTTWSGPLVAECRSKQV